MKTLLFVILILSGCSTIRQREVKTIFESVAQKEYKIHVYDCSNMSAELYDKLYIRGYSPLLIILKGKVYYHCQVWVAIGQKVWILDPANGYFSKRVKEGYTIIGHIDRWENRFEPSEWAY